MMYFCILIIFSVLYGLYGMRKVDDFIENEEVEDKNKVLIYGDDRVVKSVEEICKIENKCYVVLNNNYIGKINKNYSSLIVLSNDDLDNLMICSLGKRIYGINNIIALCNNTENKRVYEDYGAVSITYKDIYSNKFYEIIKEKINV